MDVQQQCMADLKQAMRAGDYDRRDAIRMLLAALKNEEIARRRPLKESEAAAVVGRIAKRHRESIDHFRNAGRDDLVAREEAQLAALAAYLPHVMSEADVEAEVRAVIADTGAAGPRGQGQVMAALAQRLRGRADLKDVNDVVRRVMAGQPTSG